MLFKPLLPGSLALSLLLWFAPLQVLSAPNPSIPNPAKGLSVDLVRRTRPWRNASEQAAWAQQIRLNLQAKYDHSRADSIEKRTSGYNL